MEPSPETYQKMGALCVAWSYLEMETEKTLIGMLGFDEQKARIFLWRMGMRQRWQLIVKEADTYLQSSDTLKLKNLNKKIEIVMRDRNIIVHGLVHAHIKTQTDNTPIPIERANEDDFTPPCWTIFMGEGAGNRYLISTIAVSIVLNNLQKLGEELLEFNRRLNFKHVTEINSEIQIDWPKPF